VCVYIVDSKLHFKAVVVVVFWLYFFLVGVRVEEERSGERMASAAARELWDQMRADSPENRVCVDCNANHPQWASGLFV